MVENTQVMQDSKPGNIVQIDEAQIKSHLNEVVRETVEETLNRLLDEEADRTCGAGGMVAATSLIVFRRMRIDFLRFSITRISIAIAVISLVSTAQRAQNHTVGDYDSVGAHPDHPALDTNSAASIKASPARCATANRCARECDEKKNYLSCFELGGMYASGRKAEKNPGQATEYYQNACELGDGYLCELLGWELRYGTTLRHDEQRAALADTRACEKGIAQACFSLGKKEDSTLGAVNPVPAGETPVTAAPVIPPQPAPPPNCSGGTAPDGGAARLIPVKPDRSYLPDVGEIVESTEIPEPPVPLKQPRPNYPDPMMERTIQGRFYVTGMSGRTDFEVIIDENGEVTHPLLLCADNLRKSVYELAALRTWRYSPGSLRGKPVKVRMKVSFNLQQEKPKLELSR